MPDKPKTDKSPKGTATVPPATEGETAIPTTQRTILKHDLSITVSGAEHVVRRAVTALSFAGGWDPTVARQVAIDETLVSGVTVADTLGGPKVALVSQEARDLYVQRCVRDAKLRGHQIQDPSKIPADNDTKVGEVGDALFDNSIH